MPDKPSPQSASRSGSPVNIPPGPLSPETVSRMIDQAIVNAFGTDTFQAISRSILDKVEAEGRINNWHPGTVITDSYDGASHECTLWLDGNPQNGVGVTHAQVLVPQILFPGQRVMVQFAPPHQAYITGTISPSIPPAIRTTDFCNPQVVTDTDSDLLTMVNVEDLTSGMTLSSTTDVVVPVDGIYRAHFAADVTFTDTQSVVVVIAPTRATSIPFLTQPDTGVYDTTTHIELLAFRIALRAGDSLHVGAAGQDSGSAIFNNKLFEVEYDAPYATQTGTSCGA